MNPLKFIKLLIHNSKDIKDLLYVGVTNLIGSIIRSIFWLILASIIDVSVYGELNYYIATASLFATFSLLGLHISSITYISKGNKEFLLESLMLVIITTSIASIIIAILLSNIILSILVIGSNLYAMLLADMLGNKLYKKRLLFILLGSSSRFILSITLYFIFGIEGVILGYSIPVLVLGSLIFLKYKDNNFNYIKNYIKLNHIKKNFRFISSVYISQILSSLQMFVDKLIIASLFGFEVLGLYQLGFQLFMFLAIIPSSLLQYLQPQEASGINRKFVKILGLLIAIIVVIISFIILPLLIDSFFPKYIESIPAARIMLLAIIPMTFGSLLRSKLLGNEESRIILISSLAYIGLLFPLIIILGNMFGLVGLSLSIVLSITISVALVYIYAYYVKGIKIW